MKTVLDELRERRNQLKTLRFQEDTSRPHDLLVWLEAQPEINAILVELRNAVDANSLFSPHRFRPKAKTHEEIIAVGLHLLDKTKSGLSLHHSASKYGIKPPHGANRGQVYIDEAMRCYIDPLLDDLEARLADMDNRVSVDKVAELRLTLLSEPGFQSAFPRTSVALDKIAAFCGQPGSAASWFHVAVSCREVLGIFVKELVEQTKVTPPPELKQGDTKGILKQLAKERADAGDALVDLIQAVWTYVQSNVHRQSATKEDAMRAFLWTGLLISEIRLVALLPAR